ncbi:MAG: hypothetical protein U9N63_05180, partial [Pseudomonadota bacterium]|nr:hypothetical protein [Pseudomonadota bacterium]
QSLAIQVRYLRKRLEYHLLGNHPFANGKALVFAGLFLLGLRLVTGHPKGATHVRPNGADLESLVTVQRIVYDCNILVDSSKNWGHDLIFR